MLLKYVFASKRLQFEEKLGSFLKDQIKSTGEALIDRSRYKRNASGSRNW